MELPNMLLLGATLIFSYGCTENVSGEPADTALAKSVAIAGNTFVTVGEPGQVGPDGIRNWENPETIFSTYIASDRDADVEVSIRARSGSGPGLIAMEINGIRQLATVSSDGSDVVTFGEFKLSGGRYNRIDLQGVERSGDVFAEVSEILLHSSSDLELTYVKSNENNRYYWGRRGPSVHLRYEELPEGRDLEWFYSEITVPEGEDPAGSFYMTNGFGQGYFGIQVNSTDERRILFSVWSPYQTDNPDEIPEEQRIVLLEKGEDVHTGEFGNEGSGGQSYLRYSWEAGKRYRLLNSVRPDGEGSSIYSAYFRSPDRDEWLLIARFRRPQTDSWYTSPHAFLESFLPVNGFKGREALYHNQWVRDSSGQWHEVVKVTFTGDDIARAGYRADFAGGVRNGSFYLKNGSFFVGEVPLDSPFVRPSHGVPPDVEIDRLP